MTELCGGRLCITDACLRGNIHEYHGWHGGMQGFVVDSNGDGRIDDAYTAKDLTKEYLQREVSAIRNTLMAEVTAKAGELKRAMQTGRALREVRAFDRCKGKGNIYADIIRYGGIEARDYGQDGTYEYMAFDNNSGVQIFIDAVSEVELIMFPSCTNTAKPGESVKKYLDVVNNNLGRK